MGLVPRIVHRGLRVWWWLVRPITVGVRVMLVKDDTILLVKHTYGDSWYFPGGGIRKGESLEEAVRREAAEEVGATLENLGLFGVYSNFGQNKSDHSAVFLSTAFTLSGRTDREIERFGLFAFDDLPRDVSIGTRRRLQEYSRGDAPCFGLWRERKT